MPIQLLRYCKLRNPSKSDLLVFDDNLLGVLSNGILDCFDFKVLSIRQRHSIKMMSENGNTSHLKQFYWLGPKVLLMMFLSIVYIDKISSILSDKSYILSYLKWLNIIATIKVISPSVIITCNDHHGYYFILSSIFPNIQFVVVQHGALDATLVRSYPKKNAVLSHFVKNLRYYSFGESHIDLYVQNGYSRNPFRSAGSLILSKAWNSGLQEEYDVCIISEYRSKHGIDTPVKSFGGETWGKKYADHFKAIACYVELNNLSMCIALRSDDSVEKKYYSDIFGSAVVFIENNRILSSSYTAIQQSKLIIASCSTMGMEALGLFKKIFIYDLYHQRGISLYTGVLNEDMPIYTTRCESHIYRKKLDYLILMSNDDYRQMILPLRKKLMNNNLDYPLYKHIQNYIRELLYS